MQTDWQPYSEPLHVTLRRTIVIALVVGLVVSLATHGGLSRWPMATLLMLWPSFGGHWIELWFLNWLRPRLSPSRVVHIAARIAVWFAGGIVLGFGMYATARVLPLVRFSRWTSWWIAGLAFIGVELIAQAALHLRDRPSFYNGRG